MMPDPEPSFSPRRWTRILGWVWVGLGSLGVLVTLWVWAAALVPIDAGSQAPLLLKAARLGAISNLGMALLIGILGYFLAQGRRWAYRFALLACWTWILGSLGFLSLWTLSGGALPGMGQRIDLRFASWIPHLSLSFLTVVLAGIPGFVSLVLLRRAEVQTEVHSADPTPGWVDRLPLPTLGYGWYLLCVVFSLGGAWYLTGGVIPFFGVLQSGKIGGSLYLAFGALFLASAVGVFRNRRFEWIGSMLLGTLLTLSVLRTFLTVDAVELFQALGVTGLQFEFLNRSGISNTAVLTMLGAGIYAASMAFWLWNEKSFRDTRDFMRLQESGFVLDERIQVALAVVLGVLVGAGLYAYQQHRERRGVLAQDRAEADRPRREAAEAVTFLRAGATAREDGPLIFPLLDAAGRVTPLGSAISYWAMVRFADVPSARFSVPDAGMLYGAFGLFGDRASLPPEVRKQMVVRSGAKDFGSGTWTSAGSATLLRFRFWGTRPAKEYSISLVRGSLHLAPGWVATCLYDYLGVRTTREQSMALSAPVFATEAAFRRSAVWETVFRRQSAWVVGWDQVLPPTAENPYGESRWAVIHLARGEEGALERLGTWARQGGGGVRSIRAAYVRALIERKRYAEALHESIEDLRRDHRCLWAYRTSLDSLLALRLWDEALGLAEVWRMRRPDQAEASLRLAEVWRAWAKEALPQGLADPGTGEGARLYRQRLAQGWGVIQKALQTFPEDSRVWCAMADYGRDTGLDPKEARVYLDRASELLPEDPTPAGIQLEYLMPRGSGSVGGLMAFASSRRAKDPALYCKAWQESVFFESWGRGGKGGAGPIRGLGDKVRSSGQWPRVEAAFREALQRDPLDVDTWDGYLYWSAVVGGRDAVFAYAKTLSARRAEWSALYPHILLRSVDQDRKTWGTGESGRRDVRGGDASRRMTQALLILAQLEKDDPYYWNLLARHASTEGPAAEAARAFKVLGDRWSPSVWDKDEFEKARAAAQKGRTLSP